MCDEVKGQRWEERGRSRRRREGWREGEEEYEKEEVWRKEKDGEVIEGGRKAK